MKLHATAFALIGAMISAGLTAIYPAHAADSLTNSEIITLVSGNQFDYVSPSRNQYLLELFSDGTLRRQRLQFSRTAAMTVTGKWKADKNRLCFFEVTPEWDEDRRPQYCATVNRLAEGKFSVEFTERAKAQLILK